MDSASSRSWCSVRCVARPRPALRITFRKYHIADVERVYEVGEYLDLATLEPVLW